MADSWRVPSIDLDIGRFFHRTWRKWRDGVARNGKPISPPIAREMPEDRVVAAGDRSGATIRRSMAAARLALLIEPLCGGAARPVADRLLDHFGSLPAVLRADRRTLLVHLLGSEDVADLLLAIRPLAEEMLLTEMLDRPLLPDNRAAIRYLHAIMAHEPAEHIRMLYLDAKNRLLLDEVATRGSVSRTDISPREIVRRALDVGATGMIMAHNHPSGDPQPSRQDLAATRAVADAARLFDIGLHDHIVVSRSGYRSLREEGYL